MEASKELDSMEAALVAFGMGAGTAFADTEKRACADRIMRDRRLLQIAEVAGRLRAQAAQKQRTKVVNLPEEIHGIKKGDDLQHLLASEVGLMANDSTRDVLMHRLSEKSALQYELTGTEKKTRGPIIFCVDTSGSMSGQRDVWAKACALAMMDVARRQNRSFAILYFNSGVHHRYLVAEPSKVSVTGLLDALSVGTGGGTDIASAMGEAAKVVETGVVGDKAWKVGKDADVIVVSDGDDHSSQASVIRKLHELEASVYAIFIQASPSGALKTEADGIIHMSDAELRSSNAKLDMVFSI